MKKAYYHKVPCYFNPETGELSGRNWFMDLIIEALVYIDVYILEVDEFKIYVKKD